MTQQEAESSGTKRRRLNVLRNDDDGLLVGDTFRLVCLHGPLQSLLTLLRVQYQWWCFANQCAYDILTQHEGIHCRLREEFRVLCTKETTDHGTARVVCGRPWFSYLTMLETFPLDDKPDENELGRMAPLFLRLPPRFACSVAKVYFPVLISSGPLTSKLYGKTNLLDIARAIRRRIKALCPRVLATRAKWEPQPELTDLLNLLNYCLFPEARYDFLEDVDWISTMLCLCIYDNDNHSRFWPWLLELWHRGQGLPFLLDNSGVLSFLDYVVDSYETLEESEVILLLEMVAAHHEQEHYLAAKHRRRNEIFLINLVETIRLYRDDFSESLRDAWRRIIGHVLL